MKKNIRITFICGSLEPGKDGVGDYVLRLGNALAEKGLSISLLALYDAHIDRTVNAILNTTQGINCCRLPRSMAKDARVIAAKNFIEGQNPDWVSLQYVPYAFHTQGIPFHLPSILKNIVGKSEIHIMLHESHLGGRLSLKNNFVRVVQIWVAKRLISLLKPAIIHTSNSWYQSRLRQIGIEAEILGLFGNIPIVEYQHLYIPWRDKIFTGVYFGIAPPLVDWENFMKSITKLVGKIAPFKIIFAGNLGPEGEKFIAYLKSFGTDILADIEHVGIMSAESLSALFQNTDFGITRVRPHLIGKSGSTIALLEHGLKLWIPLSVNQAEIAKWIDYRPDQCFHDLINLNNEYEPYLKEPRIDSIVKELNLLFVD